jgi:hypothetical protein
MKKSIVGLLWLMTLPLLAQQTETRAVGSFRGVKVSSAIDAYLKKGDKESVRVEVTGSSPSEVVTEIEGSSLRIKMRDGHRFWRDVKVKVYVTYVNIDRISASSAASVFSEGVIKADRIDIGASSAANIEVSLEANTTIVDTSSAGEDVDCYRLECETVVASVSSGGEAKISVSKDLEAHASSGGDIRYRGNPSRTNTHSSSGGSVKKSN